MPLMALAINSFAQTNEVVKSAGYLKNDQLFYQVSGCVPQSTVEVYSDITGGKMVLSAIADDRGVVLIQIPEGAKYSFALNSDHPSSKGAKGNGFITELKAPVVTARSFTVTESGKPFLQWEIISKSPGITCDIFRNDDMAGYKKIGSVSGKEQQAGKFIFTDAMAEGVNAATMEYDIKITDAVNQLQFTLGSQKIDKEFVSTAKVYPSIFNSTINVAVPDNVSSGTLTVFDNAGHRVYSVNVKAGMNRPDLSKLSAANYIVQVTDNTNKVIYRGRIVKSN